MYLYVLILIFLLVIPRDNNYDKLNKGIIYILKHNKSVY